MAQEDAVRSSLPPPSLSTYASFVGFTAREAAMREASRSNLQQERACHRTGWSMTYAARPHAALPVALPGSNTIHIMAHLYEARLRIGFPGRRANLSPVWVSKSM
jgi:hypothetical protein